MDEFEVFLKSVDSTKKPWLWQWMNENIQKKSDILASEAMVIGGFCG